MVTILTAKVKEKWKNRQLNQKKLKTYWHALYPLQTDYVNTLTANKKAKSTDG